MKFTDKQVKELENNKYVKKCTNKSLLFTKEFKIKLISLSEEGYHYKEIFTMTLFPEYIIDSKIPENCYYRWKNIYNNNGLEGIERKPGRTKKELSPNNMSKDEYIKYLEAKVEIYKHLDKKYDLNGP